MYTLHLLYVYFTKRLLNATYEGSPAVAPHTAAVASYHPAVHMGLVLHIREPPLEDTPLAFPEWDSLPALPDIPRVLQDNPLERLADMLQERPADRHPADRHRAGKHREHQAAFPDPTGSTLEGPQRRQADWDSSP